MIHSEQHRASEPRIIPLPRIADRRGNLSFIEDGTGVPFEIGRVYWINDVPGDGCRYGRALRTQHELLVALSGRIVVETECGGAGETFVLDRPDRGLLLPAMTWRRLSRFATNSVALVLASAPYDEEDYVREYDEFKRLTR